MYILLVKIITINASFFLTNAVMKNDEMEVLKYI